jgi:hypothetical protein
MHKTIIAYVILLILTLTACHAGPNKKSLAYLKPKFKQSRFFVKLEALTQETPHKVWEQFFTERGASKSWEDLQKKDQWVHINLNCLEPCPIPDQADQVGKAIIQYLSYHNLTVEGLKLISYEKQQLTRLLIEIGKLTKLKSLDLSENRLSQLPPEIGKLTKLKSLDLSDNRLSQLPPEIGKLVNLMGLNLKNNQLNKLPPEIGNLTNLNDLNLENNQLNKLPPEIGNLTNLIRLILSFNALTTLPLTMRNLRKLIQIDLIDNKLTVLPASLKFIVDLHSPINLEMDSWPADYYSAKLDLSTLATYAYQSLPRSLFDLCARQIATDHKANQQQSQQIIKQLPGDLQPSVLVEKMDSCPLIQGKRITYLHDITWEDDPSEGETIPFYWDKSFYTSQDVKVMLEALKDKKVFLVSEHHFPQ